MDGVAKNMYILAVASLVSRSRLVLQSSIESKLGGVSLAGYIRDGRGIPLTRMRTYLDNFALVYLLEGSGRMKVGNLPILKCRAGDLLFIHPDTPHGYGPASGENWSEFYIVIHGPAIDLWRKTGLLNPQFPIQRLRHIRRWLPQLEAIVSPNLPDTVKGMLQRICLLQKFLADITEEVKPPSNAISWLEPAMDLLATRQSMPPAAIARSIGLSYRTFRKEFSNRVGMPPGRYRLVRLIEQAKELMTERNLSNKQIAETLGFCDEFHFSRRFRKIAGKSPRTYRRLN